MYYGFQVHRAVDSSVTSPHSHPTYEQQSSHLNWRYFTCAHGSNKTATQ